MITRKLLEFNAELVTHNAKCRTYIMNLTSQLKIVLGNIDVIRPPPNRCDDWRQACVDL